MFVKCKVCGLFLEYDTPTKQLIRVKPCEHCVQMAEMANFKGLGANGEATVDDGEYNVTLPGFDEAGGQAATDFQDRVVRTAKARGAVAPGSGDDDLDPLNKASQYDHHHYAP